MLCSSSNLERVAKILNPLNTVHSALIAALVEWVSQPLLRKEPLYEPVTLTDGIPPALPQLSLLAA